MWDGLHCVIVAFSGHSHLLFEALYEIFKTITRLCVCEISSNVISALSTVNNG